MINHPKIISLENYKYLEPSLRGLLNQPIVIQEKLDGSQFRFGINDKGELWAASKNQMLDLEKPEKLFRPICDYLLSIKNELKNGKLYDKGDPFTIFGETLCAPRHNKITYASVPKNHLAIFAVSEGNMLRFEESIINAYACFFDFDAIPFLPMDTISDISELQSLLGRKSHYGNSILEGVVIKNANQTMHVNGHDFPLMIKLVREDFKEQLKIKTPKPTLHDLLISYCSTQRWEKAVIHLQEMGELRNSFSDIGKLCSLVASDVVDEEKEVLKEKMFEFIEKDLRKIAVKGLPEWYKARMAS